MNTSFWGNEKWQRYVAIFFVPDFVEIIACCFLRNRKNHHSTESFR